MIEQQAAMTPANTVAAMLKHATTKDGLEQLRSLTPYEGIYYDYEVGAFTDCPSFGRTIRFGSLEEEVTPKEFEDQVRDLIDETALDLFEEQTEEGDRFSFDDVQDVSNVYSNSRRLSGDYHHALIEPHEYRAAAFDQISHDWLSKSLEERLPQVTPHWETYLREASSHFLAMAADDAEVSVYLLNYQGINRLVTDDMDALVSVIAAGLTHDAYNVYRITLRSMLRSAREAVAKHRALLTESNLLQLIQALEKMLEDYDDETNSLEDELVAWRSVLDAEGEILVNLNHRMLEGVIDGVTYCAEIPAYVAGDDTLHSLTPQHYRKLSSELTRPIRVSQPVLDTLKVAIAMRKHQTGEAINLDLDHFQMVEIRLDDEDWIRRAHQPLRIEWTLKTQA